MAGVKGQPGTKPIVVNPVPGQQAKDDLNDFWASGEAAPAALPVAAEGNDDFFAAEGEPPAAPVDPNMFDTSQPSVEDIVYGRNPGQPLLDRIIGGLAANDTEKLSFLKQKYGEKNAVIKDGNIWWRKGEGEKFKRFDPDTAELLADTIGDMSRTAVTESVMLGGEITGGMAGGPTGAYIGRVGTAPIANEAADWVAEKAGVPQDPNRSKVMEGFVSSGVEAIAPGLGFVASAPVKAIAKRIPGSMAYKAAKEAGEREIVALSRQSQEFAQALDELKQAGKGFSVDGAVIGLPGTKIDLMGHHLNPNNPVLQKYAAVAAEDPRFINVQQQYAEGWGDLVKNTLEEIGRKNVKGPYVAGNLADRVVNATDDILKAEAAQIKKFKDAAIIKSKNGRTMLDPEASMNVQEMMNDFGFKLRTGKNGNKWIAPTDLKPLVGRMGTTSMGEVRSVVNTLDLLAQQGQNGFRITDLDGLRNVVGSLSDRMRRTPAGARLGKLSGDLRKTYRRAISDNLETFEKAEFNSAMDDYSALRENLDVIKNSLDDDMSSKALIRNFFTGKENLQKIRSIKKISPESFADLREEFANQLLVEFSNREGKTGISSGKFLNSLDKKYGEEFMREVFDGGPGPGLDDLKKALTVTETIERNWKGAKVDQMDEKQKQGVMNLFIGMMANIKFKTVNGITALLNRKTGEDVVIQKILTRDGIDKFVTNYPGKIDKPSMIKKLNQFLANSRVVQMGVKGADTAAKVADKAGKRIVKPIKREEYREKAAE